MDRMHLDFVHALRALRRRPGATLATMLVLALGVGLVTAMFALADPFLLKTLPYAEPERLVVINVRSSGMSAGPAIPRFAEWQVRVDLFGAVAAYRRGDPVRFRVGDGAVVLRTAQATEHFFEVLGQPVPTWTSMHRETTDQVLSLALLAPAVARLSALDQTVIGQSYSRPEGGTVRPGAGLPGSFVFPSPDIVFPIEAVTPVSGADLSVGSGSTILARLAPGVGVEAVRTALQSTLPDGQQTRVDVQLMSTYMTRRVRPIAAGAVVSGVFILLLCAANVASLLLARGLHRGREFATRLALGASRVDLVRLALVELTLLVLGGIVAGLWLAHITIGIAGRAMPGEYLALGAPNLTARSVVFAWIAGLVVALMGTVPAWAISRVLPSGRIAQTTGSDARPLRVLRIGLAATQIAFTTILLIGAALMTRSYSNLVQQDTGFSGDVLVLTASYLPAHGGARLQGDIDTTIERLRALSGAQAAGAAVGSMLDRLIFPGQLTSGGQSVRTVMKRVTSGYFEAVGNLPVAGRALTEQDDPRSAMVVTTSVARQLWPGEDPLGRRVGAQGSAEVIGVVQDEINFTLDAEPEPALFVRMQNPWSGCSGSVCGQVSYVVRLGQDSPEIREAARRAIVAVNRDAVVFETATIRERLSGTIKDRSFATLVLLLFSVAAVAVSATSLGGLVAFVVGRRTREIAIRVALGAVPAHVLRTVSSEALLATVAGVGAGILVGRWGSSSLEHLVFGVQPGDWWTTVGAVLLMLIIVAAAVAGPAMRALRLSPTVAMRID